MSPTATTRKRKSGTRRAGPLSRKTPPAAAAVPTAPEPTPNSQLPTPNGGADLVAWRRVNRIQLADLLGTHPDTVTDYKRQGMPTLVDGGQGRESVYDAVDCLAWWRARQGQDALDAARTRNQEAQAARNELQYQVARGELVKRENVLLAGQSQVRAWSAKVWSLPILMRLNGFISREKEPGVTALCRSITDEIMKWNYAELAPALAAASAVVDESAEGNDTAAQALPLA